MPLSFLATMLLRRSTDHRMQIARVARGEFTDTHAFDSDAVYKPTHGDRGGAGRAKGSNYDWVYGKHATDKLVPDTILAAFDRYRDAEMTYAELEAAISAAGLESPPTPKDFQGYVRELVYMQILVVVD